MSQPLFDPATRYRIEVQGRVDPAWLQSIDVLVEVAADEAAHQEPVTVLEVRADQAGIMGLVRRLHGLGVVIRQLQVIS